MAEHISKDELLQRMEKSWEAYSARFKTLGEYELTEPSDAAGWSVKDHLMHLALWEDNMSALLDRLPRHEHMGVDEETWEGDIDTLNDVLKQRHQDMSLQAVLQKLEEVHFGLVEKIRALPDSELQRPYLDFQADAAADDTFPVILRIGNNTYEHYEEHTPWMEEILKSNSPQMSKAELLRRMDDGFKAADAYFKSLSEEQLSKPTDAAGWTAKDHIAHLGVWEESMIWVLNGEKRTERMGIDEATWEQGFDAINAVIQKRYQNISTAEAFAMFEGAHRRLVEKINGLSEEDLHKPYRHYQPTSSREAPVILWLQNDSYLHYAEHKRWIAAIVAGK